MVIENLLVVWYVLILVALIEHSCVFQLKNQMHKNAADVEVAGVTMDEPVKILIHII